MRLRTKKLLRRTGYLALGIGGAFALFWWWQPWDFDLVPQRPLQPLPLVDPDSGKLFAKGTRVLVVTAHPDDDEAFYLGGTLWKLHEAGVELAFVVCTDGDKAYYGPFANSNENRSVRHRELMEVARKLGSDDVTFLGYPDGRLTDTAELESRIAEQIKRFRPDYIAAFDARYPWRFSHSDHRRAGEATAAAARKTAFEGWMLLFMSNAATYRVDVEKVWDRKVELLATHRSQFSGDRLKRIVDMVRSRAVEEGATLRSPLAEGFRATRIGSDPGV